MKYTVYKEVLNAAGEHEFVKTLESIEAADLIEASAIISKRSKEAGVAYSVAPAGKSIGQVIRRAYNQARHHLKRLSG